MQYLGQHFLSFYNIASRFLYEITPQLTEFIRINPSLQGAERRSPIPKRADAHGVGRDDLHNTDDIDNSRRRTMWDYKEEAGGEENWIEY